MRGVIYARFSSDNQREESIDAQIRAIEEYAKRNDIKIVKQYIDRAKSATTDKRPQFQQMIKDSALGIFDVVIVHKLDRFSRDRYDSAVNKRKLRMNGVRLISVIENLDGSPESIMLESLLEGMAEYYSKNLAREVMKGMNETALKCKHTGGTPPLGYDVAFDKTYMINEKEAIVVREIFDMYVNGYSYKEIIENLNEKGYKTKLGRTFGKNSIYNILENEKYSGVYVFNKASKKDIFGRRNSHSHKENKNIIRIEGGMPAIVSKEIFQKSKAMMLSRKKAPGANKAKELYLLSGLIFCGECGRRMHGNRRTQKNKQKYSSYRCSCRMKSEKCKNKEIRKEYIEEFVLSELEKNILNDEAIPYIVKKINEYLKKQSSTNETNLNSFKEELRKVNKQIENIINAISNGFFQESFKIKMDDLEVEKANLEMRIKDIELESNDMKVDEAKVKELFTMFKTFIMEKNLPECKKFIHNYVKKVEVYRDHVEVIFNVVFEFLKDIEDLNIRVKINKIELIERYSNSFYINVD
ncbi:MAG: recombinase family protein [Tepidibacter sp.]|jgi:site-specific DNA recombinase|uniref:recombinase family protein n=1 Tax=Tepidibacter sp. TaxID=2529387 RepID=UPI0025D62362|nr:recombinase family protein [Tepidibacter sp.]MCT4508473.1 recombinase family protein [Tepidibacter sp.]